MKLRLFLIQVLLFGGIVNNILIFLSNIPQIETNPEYLLENNKLSYMIFWLIMLIGVLQVVKEII